MKVYHWRKSDKIYIMEYKNFEQHIAETLHNDEVYLDTESLISDIHGEKKNDRKFVFWILSAIIVIGLVIGYVYSLEKPPIDTPILPSSALHAQTNVAENDDALLGSPSDEYASTLNDKSVYDQNVKTSFSHFPTKKNKLTNQNLQETLLSNRLDGTENHESNQRTIDQDETINDEQIHRSPTLIEGLQNSAFKTLENYNKVKIKTDKVICPSFAAKKRILFELIPEVGMFLPIKSLEKGIGESNSVFDLRKNNEKTLEGINAGLYMQLSREKLPIYLKAGLSWSQFTERMELSYAYTRRDTTQGIISITYSQTGDTITTIIGDIITDRKLSGNKTRHHSITLWDLPIAIGYEKSFGRWYAGIEGGAIINLSMKSEGNILSSDTSFVAVNVPQDQFRSSLGLSYFGGVQVGREFLKAGRLYLAVRGRYIPNSFNSDINLINQRYQFLGVNLGYVWSF